MTTDQATTDDTVWLDLVDELTLVIGTEYIIQNVSPRNVQLSEKATIPVAGSAFHKLGPGEWQFITPETGLGLWIKGNSASVTVSVTESP